MNRKDKKSNAGENHFTGAEPVLRLQLFCGPLRRPLGSHHDAAPSAVASTRGAGLEKGLCWLVQPPPHCLFTTRVSSAHHVPVESLSAGRVWTAGGPDRLSVVSPYSLSASSPSRSQITVMGLLRIRLRVLYLLLAADGGMRGRPYLDPPVE